MSIVTFFVNVPDLEGVLALYDRIQVWRSPDKTGAPTAYTEVTTSSSEDTPAILDGSVAGPWNLNGMVLSIAANGADPVSVTFSGTNPFNLETVLEALESLVYVIAEETPTDTNKIRLRTRVAGTASSLLISGTAAAVLGLSTTKVNGKASRIVLTSPTEVYEFSDFDGNVDHWYKTRFSSSVSGATSEFSSPHQGAPDTVLSAGFLTKAIVDLIDGSGRPVVGRRIIFVPVSQSVIEDDTVNFGILAGVERLEAVTDNRGHAEINLVKGHTFRVFFEGTTYQREFVVPDPSPATFFDLLTVLSTAADPFSIVQAPPQPIRVS